jgi:hypothetical protein
MREVGEPDMHGDHSDQGAPSKGGAVTPSKSGPAPVDQTTQRPPVDKEIPIGTPLTPEQLRRLKQEAEKPTRTPNPRSEDADPDSSAD